MNIEKIIAEYSADYCELLEFIYGKGMLSEGGTDFVDAMFADVELAGKNCLDIGFGLAGIPFYLAQHKKAHISALEINPSMVELANKRAPSHLKNYLSFCSYHQYPSMPFPDHSFDIVYSKGVLVHAEQKQATLAEAWRVLKAGGRLIIEDWLSPQDNIWDERIRRMCEIEDLSLFAITESRYVNQIKQAGFGQVKTKDLSAAYSEYNFQVVRRLKVSAIASEFTQKFGSHLLQEMRESYQLIAESMDCGELIVMRISAIK